MAEKKPAKKVSTGFTAEERAAMRERAKETKAAGGKAAGKADLLAKIAEMAEPDRSLAEKFDAIVMAAAPDLTQKTWYGMPAYARGGDLICFFQPAAKFKARYATFGFEQNANLDDGAMWPTAFALTEITPAIERKITALVKQALS